MPSVLTTKDTSFSKDLDKISQDIDFFFRGVFFQTEKFGQLPGFVLNFLDLVSK